MEYQRHYFGKREIKDHPSKKMAFPNVCPSCGKPLRRNAKNKVGNLCRKCGPGYKQRPEMEASACKFCPFEYECVMRVHLGIWVICETPDYGDLERLKRNSDIYDDSLLERVELSLAQKCNRKELEKAISRNAPEVYKEIIDGKIHQMAIGISCTEFESVEKLR